MTTLDPISECKLPNGPEDCIQSVKFGKSSNQYLLAASWDGTVRLYDVYNRNLCSKYEQQYPMLDCAFQVCLCQDKSTYIVLIDIDTGMCFKGYGSLLVRRHGQKCSPPRCSERNRHGGWRTQLSGSLYGIFR